jgi:hypothetical protein
MTSVSEQSGVGDEVELASLSKGDEQAAAPWLLLVLRIWAGVAATYFSFNGR